VVVAAVVGGVVWYTNRTADDGPTGNWTEAVTSSARYAVELPGDIQRRRDTTVVAGAPLPVEVLVVGEGGLERLAPGAMFIEADLSGAPLAAQLAAQPELAQTLLQAQARATFEAAGVQFSAVRNVESPLGPAIRQEGTVPASDLVVRGFAALDGTTVVAAVAIFPADDAADADRTLDRIVASISRS